MDDDTAAAQVLEAPIVAILVLAAVALAIDAGTYDNGAADAQRAYEQREAQAHDVLAVGDTWCCPEDPSAPSILQNRAMQAWAGDPEPFLETFHPWFPDPSSTDLALKASWVPPGGHATHTVDLLRTGTSQGQASGVQYPVRPAHQGPAYVVPRLDTFSAEANADVLVVPVDNVWPYQTDPFGAHTDQVRTVATYERSQDVAEDNALLETYRETTGPALPDVELHWREPDWQRLEAENERLRVSQGDGVGRPFTQVLTKADLAAERLLHQDAEEEPDDPTEPHPQHPFHLQVNVTGPGANDVGHAGLVDGGEPRRLEDAYTLTVHVPRNWTDVEFTGEDRDENGEHWTDATVERLPQGGHRLTARLADPVAFNTTDPPGGVLANASDVQAPFLFHARPPTDQASTELGFHDLQARLESRRFPVHETAHLTVEVANTPGRVHRTLATHTPAIVPATDWASPEENRREATLQTVGAVFRNGGETTELHRITWTLPGEVEASGPVRVLEDYANAGEEAWSVEQRDGSTEIRWEPQGDLVDATCEELAACSVAARLALDGNGLDAHGLWAPPRLETLYDADDLRNYADWFVRTDRAWEGVPLADDRPPGFALAHRSTTVHAGPAEGSYRFTLPPTTTPTCEEERFDERDQADRRRRDDRVYYDLGPREDGLPHLDPTEAADCPAGGRPFAAVGRFGDRWRTDAIGQHAYRSVAGLSGQTVADWQNGLAESRAHFAADEVRAGEALRFEADLRSLVTTLLADDAVSDVAVELSVFDPYNAWEGEPWKQQTIWRPSGEWHLEADVWMRRASDGHVAVSICDTRETCASADKQWAPARFPTKVHFPEDTIPGTHLVVLEVEWTVQTGGGTQLTETGRLIEPVDVLTPTGDRAQAAMLGVTAWDADWR